MILQRAFPISDRDLNRGWPGSYYKQTDGVVRWARMLCGFTKLLFIHPDLSFDFHGMQEIIDKYTAAHFISIQTGTPVWARRSDVGNQPTV